jgi:hypothetical protein
MAAAWSGVIRSVRLRSASGIGPLAVAVGVAAGWIGAPDAVAACGRARRRAKDIVDLLMMFAE